jgi:predicted MPP superfamily phosphohydrolase
MRERMMAILAVFLLADIYAFQAVRTLIKDMSKAWRWSIIGAYWLIPILLVFAFSLIFTGNEDILNRSVWVYMMSFLLITYVSKVVVAGFLLIGDLLIFVPRAFRSLSEYWSFGKKSEDVTKQAFNSSRPKFIAKLSLLIGAIPFTTLIYGIVWNAYRYRVVRKTVTLDNLPTKLDGLKIIQISDIHSGSFTMKEPVRKAIDLINKEAADIVFFTGDIVNEYASEMDNFMDVFDKIKSKHGVYSILGNHDYGDYGDWENHQEKEDNFARLKEVHKELGWDLLLNENRILDIDGEKLSVIGVENYSANKRFRTAGDLKKAYEGAEVAPVKLLLSHDPSHWDNEVNKDFKDIDITFSGHTHGFQFGIKIPGFINWSPSKYLYKQWAGLYQKDNQYIYVNRGLGFLGYPGRVGMLPEITVMELKSGKLKEI